MQKEMDLFSNTNLTEAFWGEAEKIIIQEHKETADMRKKQLADKLIYLADNIYYTYKNSWTYFDLENAIRVILPFVGRDVIWAHSNDFSGKVKISRIKGNLYWKTQDTDQEQTEENEEIIAFQIAAGHKKGLCIIQPSGEDQPLVWQTTADGGEYFVSSAKRLLGLGVIVSMILRKTGAEKVTWPNKLFCVLYYVVSGKGKKMYSQIADTDLIHRYSSKVKLPLLEKAAGGKFFYRKLAQVVDGDESKLPTAKKAPKAYARMEKYLLATGKNTVKDDYRDAEMLSGISDYALAANTQLINAIEGTLFLSFQIPKKVIYYHNHRNAGMAK